MFTPENTELLVNGSEMFHVKQSADSIKKFYQFTANLLQWNKKFNLTGICDEREIVIKHLLDSLSLAKFYNFISGTKIIDLGTGAGFPGIPLYICFPDIDLFLNESVGKKVSFLIHINNFLFSENPYSILHGRAENFARSNTAYYGKFDIVTARAVGKIEAIIPLALRFISKNGVFLSQIGPNEDIKRLDALVRNSHGHIVDLHYFMLPFSDYKRTIAEIRRRN